MKCAASSVRTKTWHVLMRSTRYPTRTTSKFGSKEALVLPPRIRAPKTRLPQLLVRLTIRLATDTEPLYISRNNPIPTPLKPLSFFLARSSHRFQVRCFLHFWSSVPLIENPPTEPCPVTPHIPTCSRGPAHRTALVLVALSHSLSTKYIHGLPSHPVSSRKSRSGTRQTIPGRRRIGWSNSSFLGGGG